MSNLNKDQARRDGIFCDFTESEKMAFLKECCQKNIVNIEMESLCFSGYLNHARCKCKWTFKKINFLINYWSTLFLLSVAIVCVTLLDRLKGDQLTITQPQLLDFQERPFKIVSDYIRKRLETEDFVDFNQNRLV